MKKIALLGANFDSGNMGVGALTMGAIACVKHAWPDAEISLLEYDHHSKTIACRFNGGIIPIRMVAMRFSKKFYLHNNIAFLLLLTVSLRWFRSQTLKSRMIKGNPCLRHLHEADMVLSIAGGDSFSDIYGQARFFYIVLPLLWTIAMGKELVIMPQTIGPFNNYFARRIAAFIMKHSKVVYARDTESLALAHRFMGGTLTDKARFCFDLGFLLTPLKPGIPLPEIIQGVEREKPIVGLNISGLLCMGGYSRKNMFALKMDYPELIRSLVRYLIEEKQAIVLLVPHVFGTTQESDVSASTRFFTELTGRYGSDLLLVQGDYDQNEIKYVIGRCDFFIGSRMHACIAALSQGIPAIGIAYSRKFAGVMESIGMHGLIADPRKSPLPEILEFIGRAFDSRAAEARQLKERMPSIKNEVLQLLT